jgi:hypothetical protein
MVPLTAQVVNPVTKFAPPNSNGVVVVLPSVRTSGQATATGSLVLGIDTQANNQVGNAQILAVDANCNTDPYCGEFTTIYHPLSGADQTKVGSFIDSGSNGLFFNDTSTNSPLTACPSSDPGFYCPSSTLSLSATNISPISNVNILTDFTIANLNTLLSGGAIAAIPGVGGPNPVPNSGFDWGLPFFYGRSVYVAFENQTTSAGAGPFFAY